MKKAGMKKGKNKEFSTPYTVTNAVAKGNIITKLSLLIMGLGNIAHKQINFYTLFNTAEQIKKIILRKSRSIGGHSYFGTKRTAGKYRFIG